MAPPDFHPPAVPYISRSRTMLRLTQTPARMTPASLLKLSFHFEGNLRSRSSRCTRSPVQHLPVQRLHHRRIAVLVGVRERVAPRRNRATQLLPLGGVEPRRVADAVERLRLRELLVDERDDMAPRRERPREVPCCGRRRMKNIRRRDSKSLICRDSLADGFAPARLGAGALRVASASKLFQLFLRLRP